MDDCECDVIIKAISILVSPGQSTEKSSDSLLTLFEGNIEKFELFIQQNEKLFEIWSKNTLTSCVKDTTLVWKFVSLCLKIIDILLDSFKNAINKYKESSSRDKLTPNQAPPLSPDTLSFEQQKHILTTFQFIICLAVCPNLHHGVGIPLTKRTGFSSMLSNLMKTNSDSTAFGATAQDSELKLLLSAKIFISSLDVPSVGVLLLSRHLNDLLAILLQLQFGRTTSVCKKTEETKELQNRNSENAINGQACLTHVLDENCVVDSLGQDTDFENSLLMKSKEFCKAGLKKLTNNVKMSFLVRELILLQGGPRTKKPGFLLPAPVWLRKVCGSLLSDILLKPNGVLHIIHGVVGDDVNMPHSFSDWKKCDAAAKIIAHCPKTTASSEEYFKLISPQILSLIHIPNDKKMKMYLRLCCSIIKEMNLHDDIFTHQYILKPVMLPLLMCLKSTEKIQKYKGVIVTEEQLEQCLTDLHKIFVCGAEPVSSLTKSLKNILHPLFSLLNHCSNGCANFRHCCKELLVTYFKHTDEKEALDDLLGLVCDWQECGSVNSLHPKIVFQAGDCGGVQIVYSDDQRCKQVEDEVRIECLKSILQDLQSNGLAGDFLLHLLTNLTDIIREETGRKPEINDEHLENKMVLLEIENRQTEEMNRFKKRLIILNLIAVLSDSLHPSCIKTNKQTLDFVKVTLERGVEVCKHTEDDIFGLFESETMTMAMGLLTAIMADTTHKTTEEEASKMEELLPLLNELSTCHPEDEIQEMATDLRIAIATRGIVVSELMKNKASEKLHTEKLANKTRVTKPLIEVLSKTITETEKKITSQTNQNSTTASSSTENISVSNSTEQTLMNKEPMGKGEISEFVTENFQLNHNSSQKSKLQQVFEELCHPEIPIRGHALLTLVKLIQKRDRETMEHHETVVNILKENLAHADTYLYLPSVNGLVAMADIFPDQVVPRLAKEFSDITGSKSHLQSEHKMKVGEALVKTSRMLGDMIPKYKNVLLPSILCGIQDSDPLVRASSLSNLSQLCRQLHFSLGSHIHEIIMCCGSVLKFDTEDEVRMASALVLTQLLQGAGKDAFQILDTALRDLYRVLKSVHATETNNTVKDHVTMALNELDDIMRDVLFPKQVLTKKIKVLSAD